MAFEIIHGAGLDAYYERREAAAPRPGAAPVSVAGIDVEEGEGGACARLQVEGIRCTACVWVTERVLRATPGVQDATISYATGRAVVRWDPAQTDLASLAGRIVALGYRVRPPGAIEAWDHDLLVRMGLAIFSAMNVMGLSAAVYAGWFDGMDARFTALFQWLSLGLATPAVIWSAAPILRGAYNGVRARVLHMDLPVSIGILAMYGQALWATPKGQDTWLDSLTMLIALLFAGRVLEQRGRRRSAEAALALAAEAPRRARRVVPGGIEEVDAAGLHAGDRVEVAAGEDVAADGMVEWGAANVRQALLTGESEPVPVGVGDRVVAGAVVVDGAIRLRVEAAGADTTVARMATELAQAVQRPAPVALTDRIAPYFTGATLLLALVTLLVQGPGTAMAVLVVACPCALALASPLAVAAGLGAAARRGLLVRGGGVLARLDEVDLVVFDKTGTLTRGEPEVAEADDAVLRIAAAMERHSAHPIARAIVNGAIARGIPLADATEVVEEPGVGLSGVVDGVRWTLRSAGPGGVLLSGDGPLAGVIRLRDTLRPDAARTVAGLRARGLRVVLLSGDHPDVATRIGTSAGVDEAIGGVRPEAKRAWIAARRAEGRKVAFVGDGLNDGPALVEADVGIAMGSGMPSSVLAADAIIAHDGLGPVLAGMRAAAAVRGAVRGNVRRSLVYNLGAVTAAVLGFVNPLVAAVLMPLSSSMVVYGALAVDRRTNA